MKCNARVSLTDKNLNGKIDVTNIASTNEILQENHYYAFGMTHEGSWQINDSAKDNPYQYNGKELNTDHGLNWSDYGARYYDACIGRWSSVDPLAEKYPTWSPYNYTFNNPVKFIDPDGRAAEDAVNGDPITGFLKSTIAYVSGAANAIASNLVGGAPGTRLDPNSWGENAKAASYGHTAGDVISIGIGATQMVVSLLGVAAEGLAAPVSGGSSVLAMAPTVAIGAHGSLVTGAAVNSLMNPSRVEANDGYAPNRDLPRNKSGTPDPKADGATGAHTQLGTKQGSKGSYRQAREFDSSGKVIKDIDFTDHGRPQNHVYPHYHPYIPNPTGGTPSRSKKSYPLDSKIP